MMVRTIQHPGVQIEESEIGSYRSTVVMNNAYIMGFADRGPIYDYSWITTTKEFTKIYGEPQTEAEKYLFIAVQSVLQNGGTPIVARMPYDNKQCKAYKAMKIKWADATPLVNTDLASPVVPLEDVANRINMNKTFKDIFTTDSVTINGQPATKEFIDFLTVDQIVKQLNPYESGNAKSNGQLYDDFIVDFKLNGVYPSALNIDQAAITSMVDSLKHDQTKGVKKLYKYNEGLDICQYKDLENEILCGFADFNDQDKYYKITDKYLRVDYVDADAELQTVFISLFNAVPEDNTLSGYPCYYYEQIPLAYAKDISGAIKAGASALSLVPTSGKLSSKFEDYYTLSGFTSTFDGLPFGTVWSDTDGNALRGINGDTVAYYTFDHHGKYIIAPSVSDSESNYPAYDDDTVPKSLAPYVSYEAADGSVANYTEDIISERFGGYASDITLNGVLQTSEIVSALVSVDYGYLLPIYTNTCNGRIVSGSVNTGVTINPEVLTTDGLTHELIAFYNVDVESPAPSGTIKGKDVKGTAIPGLDTSKTYKVYSRSCLNADGMIDELEELARTAMAGSGEKFFPVLNMKYNDLADPEHNIPANVFSPVNFQKCAVYGDIEVADFAAVVTYTNNLMSIPVIDIDDDMLIQNESLVWLKTIYNNPYFLHLDDATYTALEASLMNTPEMGFKYGLYLDSEDCEISNNQYDDLVTVNQFTSVDRTIDRYGQDIDDANFIIVDKQKTVVQGAGGNIGYFTVVIDPFDALKVQRLLVNPAEKNSSSRTVTGVGSTGNTETKEFKFDHSTSNINHLDYWAYESADAWNQIYDDLLDSMDCLQRVRNADGIYIGEPNPIDGKLNILDSWSIPLTGGYYDESISKILMKKFPGIPMANVDADDLTDETYTPSVIDHNYCTHVCVAVCKTTIDQSNGKIVVNLVETFFGSLFNEKNLQNGRSLFIGDIINANSDFIEFYRNDYISAGDKGAYDPPEYRRTDVNQIFIKDSEELKNAAQLRGIDWEDYGCDALDPVVKAEAEKNYYKDLERVHIYVIDKKEVCIYNIHWEANLTSFSKKESQKVIANTSGLYSTSDGTTINIAKNFLVDMDRCIKFIKNIDDIPLHFICDAGLSTIAQFCDNVVWNPHKKSVVGEKIDPVTKKKTGVKIYENTGGWITQPFDPDNDPDGEDRYITGYEDVATWRRVVEKITSIAGEIRKDCFAIIDAPRQLTLDGAAPKIRRSKFTNNFDKTIGRCLRYISGINSSYVAGYYNWLRTTDQYTGKSIWIPPTSKIIGNYCYLNINNLPWLAPAGLTYGLISGCHAISHNPDYQEEDQIYMKSWNYIKQYPLEGLVVEGQRTLLGKESVFERVNVRLLFLDLERFAYNVSRTFKYQVNNAYTREQFVQTLKPKFEDYTLRGGIYEYLIKVDSTNNTPETIDANELRGDIFIKPARLIEFVLLNFIGTTTGTDFTELQLG